LTTTLNYVKLYHKKGGDIMSKLLKVRDVAAYYGVSVQAVYKWINEGKISTTATPGGEKRIEEEELQKISEKRG